MHGFQCWYSGGGGCCVDGGEGVRHGVSQLRWGVFDVGAASGLGYVSIRALSRFQRRGGGGLRVNGERGCVRARERVL